VGDIEQFGHVLGRSVVTPARLVVFDLDGTLIDSRRDLTDSANVLVMERGGEPLPERDIARMVGEGAALLVRRALTAAGLPFHDADVVRFLEIYDRRMLATTRPYDGMREALEEVAADATVAVPTNKPLEPALAILEALELAPLVKTTVGGNGRFPRKPDPASLRFLVETHGATPETTVMVGDTRIDFETAANAGTHVCLTRYGFGFEQFDTARLTGREALVDEPGEIPAAVRELLERTAGAPPDLRASRNTP
jgi:phosphoglycolate phosphatase